MGGSKVRIRLQELAGGCALLRAPYPVGGAGLRQEEPFTEEVTGVGLTAHPDLPSQNL